jgi:hypothetical protein
MCRVLLAANLRRVSAPQLAFVSKAVTGVVAGLLVGLLLFAGSAQATTNPVCNQQFGLDVATCQQAVDNQVLSPHDRAAARNACIQNAWASKQVCLSGGNDCLDQAKGAYAGLVAECLVLTPDQCAFDDIDCRLSKIGALGECVVFAGNALEGISANACGVDASACLNNVCETSYFSAVVGCGVSYPGDELLIKGLRFACLNAAVETLTTCPNTCLP